MALLNRSGDPRTALDDEAVAYEVADIG